MIGRHRPMVPPLRPFGVRRPGASLPGRPLTLVFRRWGPMIAPAAEPVIYRAGDRIAVTIAPRLSVLVHRVERIERSVERTRVEPEPSPLPPDTRVPPARPSMTVGPWMIIRSRPVGSGRPESAPPTWPLRNEPHPLGSGRWRLDPSRASVTSTADATIGRSRHRPIGVGNSQVVRPARHRVDGSREPGRALAERSPGPPSGSGAAPVATSWLHPTRRPRTGTGPRPIGRSGLLPVATTFTTFEPERAARPQPTVDRAFHRPSARSAAPPASRRPDRIVPVELRTGSVVPVERVHRRHPDPTPAPTSQRGRADSGSAAISSPSPIDIERLDKELWKRFEKRARLDRERHGRA